MKGIQRAANETNILGIVGFRRWFEFKQHTKCMREPGKVTHSHMILIVREFAARPNNIGQKQMQIFVAIVFCAAVANHS